MPEAKLIIAERGRESREIEILGDITTFGRAVDNSVSFASDPNVSRYHAQIARRGDDFFLADFNSRNGTTLNDEPVTEEQLLHDNDRINFGGDSQVIFKDKAVTKQKAALENQNSDEAYFPKSPTNEDPQSQPSDSPSNKFSIVLATAGVFAGLAIISVAAVVWVIASGMITFGGCCSPEAAILSPENGTTVSAATEIKIEVKDARCIERIAYLLDNEEVATAETAPYSVTLEPADLQLFADENSHLLTIAIVDRNGARKVQKDQVLLSFGKDENIAQNKSPETLSEDEPQSDDSPPETAAQVSIAEIKKMSEQFVKGFSGDFAREFDPQFLRAVQKKTLEYRSAGFSVRAAVYRDAINLAFVGEQGLDAPLGYVLAMSQSKFDNQKNGDNEGLWQMTAAFAASNGYNGQCGIETLSDKQQNCAARAAAIYAKALIVNLFQGDVVYGAACFGMSPTEAGQFQVSLPPERANFWQNIKSRQQRDALVRFFAAGLVAENPHRFGLKRDQPLSSLYRNLIILK